MFNRADDSGIARGERALLVVPERLGQGGMRSIEARIEEAAGLAAAIGIEVVERKSFRLRQIRPASLFARVRPRSSPTLRGPTICTCCWSIPS